MSEKCPAVSFRLVPLGPRPPGDHTAGHEDLAEALADPALLLQGLQHLLLGGVAEADQGLADSYAARCPLVGAHSCSPRLPG